jgi:hypothetical protein
MRLRKELPRQTAILQVRMYDWEKAQLVDQANKAKQSLSDWVRERLFPLKK